MFKVYVLYNHEAEKTYIGQTADLDKRLVAHNLKRGNHYTAKFQGEWEVIYYESLATRSEALKREKELKSARGRAYIKGYIPG